MAYEPATGEMEIVGALGGAGSIRYPSQLTVAQVAGPGGLDRIYFIASGAGDPSNPSFNNPYRQVWTTDGSDGGTRSLTPTYSRNEDYLQIAGVIDGDVYFTSADFTAQNSGVELFIGATVNLGDTDPYNDAGLYDDVTSGPRHHLLLRFRPGRVRRPLFRRRRTRRTPDAPLRQRRQPDP